MELKFVMKNNIWNNIDAYFVKLKLLLKVMKFSEWLNARLWPTSWHLCKMSMCIPRVDVPCLLCFLSCQVTHYANFYRTSWNWLQPLLHPFLISPCQGWNLPVILMFLLCICFVSISLLGSFTMWTFRQTAMFWRNMTVEALCFSKMLVSAYEPHCITTQMTNINIFTTLRISNLMYWVWFHLFCLRLIRFGFVGLLFIILLWFNCF
jgi:hypothetical protein